MLLTVLFTVLAVSTISLKEVQTKTLQGLDIENFVQSLQQQLQQEQERKSQKPDQVDRGDSTSSDDSDDDSSSDFRTGKLRGREVEELIKLAHNEREDRNRLKQLQLADNKEDRGDGLDQQLLQQLNLVQNKYKKRQNRHDYNGQLQLYRDDDNDDREELDPQLLQQLNLLQNVQSFKKKRQNREERDNGYRQVQVYRDDDENDDREELDQQFAQQLSSLQNRNKKRQNRAQDRLRKDRIKPNNLLSSVIPLYDDRNNLLQSLNNDDREDDLDLSKYSNVYLILNPDAVKKSQNKDKLNNLLTNLLSSSGQQDRRERKKDVRYKGFLVKDKNVLSRRRNRESREIYAKGNSAEGDYRPKRSRGERGSGGGGGSGRTAIPYIRHHGDIYEKDI